MEIKQNYLSILETSTFISSKWDEHLARWVSRIFSPPLLIIVGISLVAVSIGSPSAWLWAGFYVTLAVLLPVLYISWKVKTGVITDFHIKEREQRFRPMLLMVALSLLGWLRMLHSNAPLALTIFAGAGVFQVTFLFLVTSRWKISGHSTAAAGFAVFIVSLFGKYAAPVLLLIPLIAWSRIRLNRHELTQVVAGSFAGITYMLVVLYLIQRNGINFTI